VATYGEIKEAKRIEDEEKEKERKKISTICYAVRTTVIAAMRCEDYEHSEIQEMAKAVENLISERLLPTSRETFFDSVREHQRIATRALNTTKR
jgi:hypothetical protein